MACVLEAGKRQRHAYNPSQIMNCIHPKHPQLNLNWAEWSWRSYVATEVCMLEKLLGWSPSWCWLWQGWEKRKHKKSKLAELKSHSGGPLVCTVYALEDFVWTTSNLYPWIRCLGAARSTRSDPRAQGLLYYMWKFSSLSIPGLLHKAKQNLQHVGIGFQEHTPEMI